jgi:toxin ParE1/3/4
MRVIWSGPALRDLTRHTRYIVDFNPRAAARMADELLAAATDLAMFPSRGRPTQHRQTRECVAVWPYVLVYRVTGQIVEILRVWHGAQDRRS